MRPTFNDYFRVWDELPTLLFVPLTRGKFTVIDQRDWPIASQFKWYADFNNRYSRWYVGAWHRGVGGNVKLHRLLLGFPKQQVDHKNGNGLDNRRSNIRVATPAENSANAKPRRPRMKGVRKTKGRYGAYMTHKGTHYWFGTFGTAKEAAMARDVKALEFVGEFAALNYEENREHYLNLLGGSSMTPEKVGAK